MNLVIAMWAHPRSMSTAFLRMMIERGDVTVVHEPLVTLTDEGEVALPTRTGGTVVVHTASAVLEQLRELARDRPVFVKDTLEYHYDYLFDHPDEIADFAHTFIVRHPAQTISSHYAMKPTAELPEIGYEHQFDLFDLVSRHASLPPVVLEAERLLAEPATMVDAYCAAVGLPFLPDALRWSAVDRPEWRRTRQWHTAAIGSTGFTTYERSYQATVANSTHLRAYYDYHKPFYDRLVRHAIRPRGETMTSGTVDNTPPAGISPGEAFAQAFAKDPSGAQVHFDFTITDAFQPTKERPRVTVRNLLKKRPVDGATVRFWSESRPEADEADEIHEADLRREAAFRFGMGQAWVHPIQAWVQIPAALVDDPAGLAEFLDFRLLVRLATAENQALTVGPYGLLNHPDISRLPYKDDYLTGLLAACDEIEQTGATAHAMIVNPHDYYFRMLGHDAVLADLARNGTQISRTRMVAKGCALVGDFAMAARLLDGGRSVIRIAEPPPGTFATPGLAVCAEIYEGLAVHLPTHFFHVVPADLDSAANEGQ